MKSPAMKCFALIGVVLSLGMMVAPSINADVQKKVIGKESPLFSIYSSRASLQNIEFIDTDYIGDDKETTLYFDRNQNTSEVYELLMEVVFLLKKNPEYKKYLTNFVNNGKIPLGFSPDLSIEELLKAKQESSFLFTEDYFCTYDIICSSGHPILLLLFIIIFVALYPVLQILYIVGVIKGLIKDYIDCTFQTPITSQYG